MRPWLEMALFAKTVMMKRPVAPGTGGYLFVLMSNLSHFWTQTWYFPARINGGKSNKTICPLVCYLSCTSWRKSKQNRMISLAAMTSREKVPEQRYAWKLFLQLGWNFSRVIWPWTIDINTRRHYFRHDFLVAQNVVFSVAFCTVLHSNVLLRHFSTNLPLRQFEVFVFKRSAFLSGTSLDKHDDHVFRGNDTFYAIQAIFNMDTRELDEMTRPRWLMIYSRAGYDIVSVLFTPDSSTAGACDKQSKCVLALLGTVE